MKCLLVHNSEHHKGGDDTYVRFLLAEGRGHGMHFHLLTVSGPSHRPHYTLDGSPLPAHRGFSRALNQVCDALGIHVINIQTLYSPKLARACIALRPTFKTTHSTDTVCPGAMKFWRAAESPCQVPYSLACYGRAFTQHCCSRNPIAFFKHYRRIAAECGSLALAYERIIVMSDYVRRELVLAGIAPAVIALNPCATTVAADVPAADRAMLAATRLIFVGRLAVIKGVHVMLRALFPLLDARPRVQLDIVGDGPAREAFEQLVPPHMTGRVTFHGWLSQADTRRMIGKADILVFPSIYPEAFGLVGIEAMMLGKPVVAFDVGGVSEWLRHDETGLLVTAGDTDGLRRAVASLLDDTVRCTRYANNARTIALACYRPEVHLTRLADIFASRRLRHQALVPPDCP